MLNHVTEHCKHHEQLWIYLDYVYCLLFMRLLTKCGCELASVNQLSELSSILYLLSVECLAWCRGRAGEAGLGLVCID